MRPSVAVAFVLQLFAAQAGFGTILTFDLANPPGDGFPISPNYGDRVSAPSDSVGSYGGSDFTPNVVVDSLSLTDSGAVWTPYLWFWGSGFPGGSNVAFPILEAGSGEIRLVPDANYRVVLDQFRLSWWQGNASQIPITYADGTGQVLGVDSVSKPAEGHTVVSPGIAQQGEIRLRFGSSYDHAIDDVEFHQGPARVLVIVLDDVGVDLLDAYPVSEEYVPGTPEHPFEGVTPNLERLAREGVRFGNAWASPTCLISRISMLTGRHAFRSTSQEGEVAAGEVLLPQALGAAFASAGFGKWHITNISTFRPTDGGFVVFRGSPKNLGESAPPADGGYYSWERFDDVAGQALGASVVSTVYATTATIDDAITWLEQENGPALIWLAATAPHVNGNFDNPIAFDSAPSCLHSQSDPQGGKATLQALDSELGWLLFGEEISDCSEGDLDALHQSHPGWDGIDLATTTVIVIGDNGSAGSLIGTGRINSNDKGSLYEGGINVPLIITGYGVDPALANTREEALVHAVDVFATTLDLLGLDWQAPGVSLPAEMDTRSLVPLLAPGGHSCQSDSDRTCARQTVYTDGGVTSSAHASTIRDARYKLIRNNNNTCEFYDLVDDPDESNDLETGNGNVSDSTANAAFGALRSRLQDVLQTTVTCVQSTTPAPGCGLGPELALLVPMLASLRRRRRHDLPRVGGT